MNKVMNENTRKYYDNVNAKAVKNGNPLDKNEGLALTWSFFENAGVPTVSVMDKKRPDGLHVVVCKTNLRVCYGKHTLVDVYGRKGMIRAYVSRHARVSTDKVGNVTLRADTRKACKQVNTSAQKAFLYDVYVANVSIPRFLESVISMPKAPAENAPADVSKNDEN